MNITLMEAISITVSSMIIVLLTLTVIAVILSSFKYIFKQEPKKEAKPSLNKIVIDDNDEEERLVACLAASAMAGNGKVNPNLHIKRVTRII
jgi:glutaconyl-CoA/methylmalonyl-CoA decarboxylase subunit delta